MCAASFGPKGESAPKAWAKQGLSWGPDLLLAEGPNAEVLGCAAAILRKGGYRIQRGQAFTHELGGNIATERAFLVAAKGSTEPLLLESGHAPRSNWTLPKEVPEDAWLQEGEQDAVQQIGRPGSLRGTRPSSRIKGTVFDRKIVFDPSSPIPALHQGSCFRD